MRARILLSVLAIVLLAPLAHTQSKQPSLERNLFDFTDRAGLKHWSNLELPTAKEPPVKIDTDNGRLKLTFTGGNWPTITTTQVPGDWTSYHTFKATVTVTRPCLVGFTVLQEKSSRNGGWDGTISRWGKTVFAHLGKNEVIAALHPNEYSALSAKFGKVVHLEIFMYNPQPGETIHVENICLSSVKEERTSPPTKRFRVLGTAYKVSSPMDLAKFVRDDWKPPTPKTVDEIEKEFRMAYAKLKQEHPRAVLAVFRDGEKGYDPNRRLEVFAAWKDAYWSSHGPDGMTIERSTNFGKSPTQEVFMRHRSPLMRVELGSIPKGANILAARFILVRANDTYDKERDPRKMPNMWVAEACNRPWEEYEVNAYEYARNKFWKNYGGTHWDGDDPDFLPIYLAYGPGGGPVSIWDFTEAVKFWTAGKDANHGFMMHGDARDWLMRAHYRESPEVRNRPGLLVIYEPR
ncbi:MAG: hypothetical protein EXR98_02830 [Gemmataceae bacterium]|nr:hypothetical protein [Gemmataceae bacterium]